VGEVSDMNCDKVVLTPQDILEKEFKIDTRGYRLQEVDKYLDVVIKDYVEFTNIIKKLEEENKVLVEDNLNLKRELRNLTDNLDAMKHGSGNKEVTNLDILRRLSQIEKIVYGEDER
jgi:DivIVA domain-containing protein